MTCIYTVYKRHTTKQKIYTGSKWRVVKIFQENGHENISGAAILISDKIDFKTKAITRDKEGHYMILKGVVQEGDIILVNIYASNIGAPEICKGNLGGL